MSHSTAHSHHHAPEGVSDRALLWAVGANVGLSVFEVIGGVISGSVALMADALHNFNDCAALFIAYVARRIGRRGANERFTFSYRRAELIGAMINLTALVVVGLYLIYEAVSRLAHPNPLHGGWIMAAAGVALLVDVVTAWLLWAMSRGSMNVRAAFVHNLSDALASLAVLAGGAAVYFWDWNWVDPTLTILIAGYILYLSVGMLRETARILMEATPEGIELREVQRAIREVPEVDDFHHVHIWEIDEQHRALEAHVAVSSEAMPRTEDIKHRVKDLLAERFSIHHTTLEFEVAGRACRDHDCRLVPRER